MVEVTRKNPNGINNLTTRLQSLDGFEVRAGWFKSSKYEDGTSVAYVASIHEFGVQEKNIPARPFMRPTVNERSHEWNGYVRDGARAVLEGRLSAVQVMDQLGAKAAGDVAKTITRIWEPPLKEATVRARARSYADVAAAKTKAGREAAIQRGMQSESLWKPLVDSGKLLDDIQNTTINHQVIRK